MGGTAACLSVLNRSLPTEGLTYWLNGFRGYSCLGFKVVMGACLSASNALTFVHLFIFSNSLMAHQTSNRYCLFVYF